MQIQEPEPLQARLGAACQVTSVTRAHPCFVGQVEVFGRQVLKAPPLQM